MKMPNRKKTGTAFEWKLSWPLFQHGWDRTGREFAGETYAERLTEQPRLDFETRLVVKIWLGFKVNIKALQ